MHHRLPLAMVLFVLLTIAVSWPLPVTVAQKTSLKAPYSKFPVNIDGRWTDANEWSDADDVVLSQANRLCHFRIKHDASSVYMLWDFVSDHKIDSGSGEAGDRVYAAFDVNHDGLVKADVGPDFFVYLYWWTNQQFRVLQGNGMWGHTITHLGISAASSLTASPLSTDPHLVYEMAIDEASYGIGANTVGVRVAAFDAGNPSTDWGPNFPSNSVDDQAATWADLSFAPREYELKIVVPSSIVTIPGAGTYQEGSSASIGKIPDIVNASTDVRYVRTSVLIDGQKVDTAPSTIVMNENHRIEINYQKQYYLHVISEYGNPQGEGWYDENSTASFSVSSPQPELGLLGTLGGKLVLQTWSGDSNAASQSSTVNMNGPKTVTAKWTADNVQPYMMLAGIAAAILIGAALVISAKRKKRSPNDMT
jgi:hypothetical protein